MHLSTLLLLPLSVLILSAPIIVEHEAIPARPIKHHVDPFHLIHPRCPTTNCDTKRSLSDPENAMKVNPHTTSPHRPSNRDNSLITRALEMFRDFGLYTAGSHSPLKSVTTQAIIGTHELGPRDGAAVDISGGYGNKVVIDSRIPSSRSAKEGISEWGSGSGKIISNLKTV